MKSVAILLHAAIEGLTQFQPSLAQGGQISLNQVVAICAAPVDDAQRPPLHLLQSGNELCQTWAAYSRDGLMVALYQVSRSAAGTPDLLRCISR